MKLLTTITLLCFSFAANAQESEIEARILSAYHGLDPIRPRATGLCGLPPMTGQQNTYRPSNPLRCNPGRPPLIITVANLILKS